jgi:hypothetical protein
MQPGRETSTEPGTTNCLKILIQVPGGCPADARAIDTTRRLTNGVNIVLN